MGIIRSVEDVLFAFLLVGDLHQDLRRACYFRKFSSAEQLPHFVLDLVAKINAFVVRARRPEKFLQLLARRTVQVSFSIEEKQLRAALVHQLRLSILDGLLVVTLDGKLAEIVDPLLILLEL